ncbi:MAG TPA: SDR family oxidoreductase [Nitrososphaeraceae archaeon]|jgi:uncharacterized protein YbjT (DUF2867 family)
MTTTTKTNEIAILVTGATGTVGSEVVKQLTSPSSSLSSGSRVRAAVHSKDKADKLRSENKEVEFFHMDYNKPETIVDSLNGIDKLFLLTLPTPNMSEIASRLIKEAKKNDVKHIVKLSVLDADAEPGILIGRMHRQEEKIIEESGIPYTFLRAGAFMQNFINFFGQTIRTQNAIYIPAGDGKVSFVDVRDIATVASKILLTKNNDSKDKQQYEYKKFNITGNEALSYSQAAEILSNALGRRLSYVNVTEDDARKAMKKMQMDEWLIDALMELYSVIRSGYASQTTTVIEQIIGRKPISLDQFARDHASFFG